MKVIAMSDLHGNLIHVDEQCDVVVIAGDWSPLYCQHDYYSMIEWINSKFVNWMNSLKTKYIVLIPGNHDFVCAYKEFNDNFNTIISKHNLQKKVHYLNKSGVKLFGYKFYGIPDTERMTGWAFSHPFIVDYKFDSDTDILITHQPPTCSNVGTTIFGGQFGSDSLTASLRKSNVLCNICGHIHSGEHGEHYIYKYGDTYEPILIFNVSILSEDYNVNYDYTVINFDDIDVE